MSAPAELETFRRRAHPRLVSALSFYCGSIDVAEELAQDTLVRVCSHWEELEVMEYPEAWAQRVAINLANSRFRRRSAARRAAERSGIPSRVHHDADVATRVDLYRALGSLPPRLDSGPP